MNKQILFTVCAAFCMLLLGRATTYAQVQGITFNRGIQSPTAASLGTYGDTPVNLSRGMAQVSVPLHTLSFGDIQVPISLSYAGGGLKVGEVPGWVGLGWSLNAGGVITRTARGIYDDKANLGFLATGDQFETKYDPSTNDLDSAYFYKVFHNEVDTESDVYFYNFMGYSGKFIFDYDGNIQVLDGTPLVITKNATGEITEWTVIDPNGLKYTFDKVEKSLSVSTTETSTGGGSTLSASDNYASAWYLTKIESPHTGRTVDFTYTSHSGSVRDRTDYEEKTEGIYASHVRVDTEDSNPTFYLLSTITGGNEVVNFYTTTRTDFADERRLDYMTVKRDGNQLSRFDFGYSYSTAHATPGWGDKRLLLDSVTPKGSDNTTQNGWTFTYNAGSTPSITSHAFDHWGYYNGKHGNEGGGLLPKVDDLVHSVHLTGDDRDPDAAFADNAMLNKITYPTGGHTEFEYEGHQYHQNGSGPYNTTKGDSVSLSGSTGGLTKTGDTFTVNGDLSTVTFTSVGTQLDSNPGAIGQGGGNNCSGAVMQLQYASGTVHSNILSGTNTFNVSANNDYKLYISRPNIDCDLSVVLSWSEQTTVPTQNISAGGLRIKTITHHDGISTANNVVKNYVYTATSTSSSGFQASDVPGYYYYDGSEVTSPVYMRASTPIVPLGESGHIAYTQVEERISGGQEGYVRYLFGNGADELADGYTIGAISDRGFERGQLLNKSTFTTDGTLLHQVLTNYATVDSSAKHNTSSQPGYIGIKAKILGQFTLDPTVPTDLSGIFTWSEYRHYKAWRLPISTTTHTYDPVTGDSTTVTQALEYGNATNPKLVTKSTDTNSDGEARVSKYKYAHEEHTAMAGSTVNRLNLPYSTTLEDTLGNVLSKNWTVWSTSVSGAPTGKWMPKELWTWKGANSSDVTAADDPTTAEAIKGAEVTSYDAYGNPLIVKGADGTETRYYYGTNASPYTQGTLNGIAGMYLTGVQNVHNGADVTVGSGDDMYAKTEYDNLGRITKSTSPNDVQASFTYDVFSRLVSAKNDAGATMNTTTYDLAFTTADPNYIQTDVFPGGGGATRKSRQYLDGLGRAIETLALGDTQVVIRANTYDSTGRAYRTYKPFYKTGSSLSYDSNYHSLATTAHGSNPFSQVEYEASPLGRTIEVVALGGKTANGSATTSYGVATINSNEYFYTESVDPDGKKTRNYTDGWGRTYRTVAGVGTADETTTEFVYDKRDLLLEVRHPNYFSPPTGSVANDWRTLYTYDQRGNQLSKASNDFGTANYIYDQANRIRFSQTANQAAADEAGFVSYDDLGRITKTGVAQNIATFSTLDPETTHTFENDDENSDGNLKGASAYDGKPSNSAYPWSIFSSQITAFSQNSTNVKGQMAASMFRVGGDGIATVANITGQGFSGSTLQIVQAADTVKAGVSSVDNDGNVVFEAGKAVLLSHGFSVDLGGDFNAKVNAALQGTAADGVSSLTGNNPWQLSLYDYDSEGRVSTRKVYTWGISDWDATITYSYNDLGEITRQGTTIAGQTLYQHYSYNTLGQLKDVILTTDGTADTEPTEVTYTYTSTGALNTIDYRGGDGLDYAYDIRDWVTDINSDGDHFDAAYSYNKNGNIATSTFYNPSITLANAGHKTYTTTYSYDNLNRLTAANYDAGVNGQNDWFDVSGISYDKNGNITALQRKAQSSSFIDDLTYSYSTSNRLNSVADAVSMTSETWDAEDATYGYDANGNMTSQTGKITSIIYDERNLPVHTKMTGGAEIIANYDAGGYRVVKEVKGGDWEFHLRDGDRTLAVIANNQLSYFNLYGNSMFGQITTSGGTLNLSSGQKYFLQDHLGSTRETVNGSNATQSTYDYYAFGALMPGRSGGTDNTLYKYTGHERDNEADLNLDYMKARTYDAGIGKFLQVDPMMEFASSYTYVGNNPLMFVDPTGMLSSCGIAGTAACSAADRQEAADGVNIAIADYNKKLGDESELNSSVDKPTWEKLSASACGRQGSSSVFENSVRASLNQLIASHGLGTFASPYLKDSEGGNLIPGSPVDGYAQGVMVNGSPIPGVASSILEVKASNTPFRNITSSQLDAHINYLAGVRSEFGESAGAPLYVLATLSQREGGHTDFGIRTPYIAKANKKGVNVQHYTLFQSSSGDLFLRGGFVGRVSIGSSGGEQSRLFELLTNLIRGNSTSDIPFSISCK